MQVANSTTQKTAQYYKCRQCKNAHEIKKIINPSLVFEYGLGDLLALCLRDGDVDHLALLLPDLVVDGLAVLLLDGRALLLEPKRVSLKLIRNV